MKSLKTTQILILLLLVFAVSVSVGTKRADAKAPIVLRYYTGMPASHHFSAKDMKYFAQEVEKRTQGKIKVELYPGGQLFSFIQGIDAATMGGVEMGLTSVGFWAGYNPVFQFSDYFLLIEDIDHWLKARERINEILQPLFKEHNVRILFYSAYGGNAYCGKVPVNTVGDMKGLKIRAPVPGALESLKGWGAVPVRITGAEVYDAMAKGAIDGCVTAWSYMNAMKFYEVSNYYVGPFWWTVWVNFINLDTWNAIPEDMRKIILKVSRETQEKSLTWMKAYEEKSLEVLRKKGTVKILTHEELKEWKKPLQPVYEEWLKTCADKGYGVQAKQIMEVLDKAR